MPILVKHNTKFISFKKKDRVTLIKGFLSGQMENYRTQREIALTEYWIIEHEKNGNLKSLGLDIGKRPLSRTKNLLTDYPDDNYSKPIPIQLFQDIYEMSGIRDWNRLVIITSKYMELWSKSINPDAPDFPALLIEQNGTYTNFSNSEELTRMDIAQYPWDSGEYLIDKNLNQFKTEYWNFGHPTGVVIPKGIKRKWTKEELLKKLEEEPPKWLK